MTAERVVRKRQADWERLELLLARGGRRSSFDPQHVVELASLYRAAAADAARVRAAGADDGTIAYLDRLLSRAHNRLYRAPKPRKGGITDFVLHTFPLVVRENARFVLWASAAFYAPFVFGLVCAWLLPSFGPAVMGAGQVEAMRQMYADAPEQARNVGMGSMSVSFYIQHNTSIAFRCFATGIFWGLGSVFTLVYNGLTIGAVFGVLIADEKARNLLTFTCGHSAWELTAIVIAGAAGLRMGWALVSTNGLTRLGSLRAAGPTVATLVGGAAIMLFIAACIEGLWSGSPIPAPVKWVFAVVQIVAVAMYLSYGGHKRVRR